MDRNYAYIRVVGTADSGLVTQRLGLQPTRQWNAGDLRANGTPRDASLWAYESPAFETGQLDEAIAAVVLFIEASGIRLDDLPGDFEATLQCVGYHQHQSPGFHLTGDLVRKLGRLGLAIDFDLYCHAGPQEG